MATRSVSSLWSHLSHGPIDPTFGLFDSYCDDPRPRKVNMAIGIYTNDKGGPYVLPIVKKVERYIIEKELDKEYAGIMGYPIFRQAATELVLGEDSPAIVNKLCATAQTVAGTSALRIVATFLAKLYPYDKTVYLSNHTWPNHPTIFKESGLTVERYRYYDPSTGGLDTTGLYEDLQKMPEHSIVLFQACGHNPTAVDPKLGEWAEISRICKERSHFLIFDVTYLGFASGDIEQDAAGIRKLVADGHKLALCQSFSKNMGLYGDRVGNAILVCSSEEEKTIVESQLSLVIRPMYSNPPIHGARIVTEILTNPEFKTEWIKEQRKMFDHVFEKRRRLHEALIKTGSTLNWSRVMEQKGWFFFSGITKEQVEKLEKDHGIYMSKNGRIPVVALAAEDIEYVAKAIHEVTRH